MIQNIKKIAIYIDTNALFNGRIHGLVSHIKELASLLEENKNLKLLTNDILISEIHDKIHNKVVLPNLKDFKYCLKRDQIEKVKESFEDNKIEYQEAIDELIAMGKKLEINLSNQEIMEGCEKQKNLEAPWARISNGENKTNEWKDFFVQKSLIKYHYESSNDPLSSNDFCDELIILSADKGFIYMEDKSSDVSVKNMPLNGFIKYLNQYTEDGRESFESYLTEEIYSKEGEIISGIEDIVLGIKGWNEIETYLDDIKIIDLHDHSWIICEAQTSISGEDYTNATYDNEDHKYWGVEKFNYEMKFRIVFSFKGDFRNDEYEGVVDIENIEIIEEVTE